MSPVSKIIKFVFVFFWNRVQVDSTTGTSGDSTECSGYQHSMNSGLVQGFGNTINSQQNYFGKNPTLPSPVFIN